VILEISLALGQVLLTGTALSFLGLGPPPDPSWGAMLNESRAFMQCAPWAKLAPGGAIVVTTAAFLLIGSGLRSALTPAPTEACASQAQCGRSSPLQANRKNGA
jgi:ABC-type dipeptide/oligopeptide/nickel transport system permease subunit